MREISENIENLPVCQNESEIETKNRRLQQSMIELGKQL